MDSRHVEVLLDVGELGTEIRIRNARVPDARRIQVLYAEEYGNKYPISTIYDREKTRQALREENIFWLVGEHDGKIIASLFFAIDPAQRLAKAGGAVVSRLYRKHNLAYTMMKIIQENLIKTRAIDIVYGTTRTVSTAPQYLTEHLSFTPLGIFPNAHKVYENETHTLSCWFSPDAWKKRKKPVRLIEEITPFYDIACRALAEKKVELGPAGVVALPPAERKGRVELIPFEFLDAERFVSERYKKFKSDGMFENMYVPFHEPNALLISLDQKTEIYLHIEPLDRYCMILGGHTDVDDASLVLRSAAQELRKHNTSYIEVLIDAYSPQLQRQALDARFMPSAYFPMMLLSGRKRLDRLAFSMSFDMLDFSNVALTSYYQEFLTEYLKIWQNLYIDYPFRSVK
ncbi:MAG: hypothetical protein PHW69_07485 [Elusimicrobiaceae bacterium]|nr:hypothetical protein [Elusimicrobiaceae bacterium]